jgi:hypothetical protein
MFTSHLTLQTNIVVKSQRRLSKHLSKLNDDANITRRNVNVQVSKMAQLAEGIDEIDVMLSNVAAQTADIRAIISQKYTPIVPNPKYTKLFNFL